MNTLFGFPLEEKTKDITFGAFICDSLIVSAFRAGLETEIWSDLSESPSRKCLSEQASRTRFKRVGMQIRNHQHVGILASAASVHSLAFLKKMLPDWPVNEAWGVWCLWLPGRQDGSYLQMQQSSVLACIASLIAIRTRELSPLQKKRQQSRSNQTNQTVIVSCFPQKWLCSNGLSCLHNPIGLCWISWCLFHLYLKIFRQKNVSEDKQSTTRCRFLY